jgi:hypothetical protein
MKPEKKGGSKKEPGKSSAGPSKSDKQNAASVGKTEGKSEAKSSKVGAKKKLNVPPILLEGDAAPQPSASGPGKRFATGTQIKAPLTEGELPEAYGTGRLMLTARDPRWLYAHWDLSREQLQEYNSSSRDRHLILRVFQGQLESEPQSEIHLHPESRNWFIPVPQAGARYFVELGYYDKGGKWQRISVSKPTLTPPESLSEEADVRFATIPIEVPFEQLLRLVQAAARENLPLAQAIVELRQEGKNRHLPTQEDIQASSWTPRQEKALAELITVDQVRRVWIGSLEVTELIRRQLFQAVSSAGLGEFSLPSSVMEAWSSGSLSSAFGKGAARKGFWFNVNAELIIYGATEPDAKVTIGGRPIKLRQDGTFSFRFILPDGQYDLPAVATSADGDDSRSAALKFSRHTDYSGEVGAHPQDPKMPPPSSEHVS